jgi:nucleotide-binding universal stress UspA family protein
MPEKILVTLDGSDAAEMALPYAEEIASRMSADIYLVTVSEPGPTNTDHLYHYYLERITRQAQDQLKKRGAKDKITASSQVLIGKPANEILRFADEKQVSLIVMASRGSSGEGPWLLGDIAAKVLRASEKPVLLVRRRVSETARQQPIVKKILAPLDGSKTGEAALSCAERLAQAVGAEVVLFQVVEPFIAIGGGEGLDYSVSQMYPEVDERRRASTLAYLDGIGKQLQAKGIKTASAVVSGSEPTANQIIGYAEANNIDLIAMSTHGRSGIGRWVFGSVTDKLLHAGDIPILVVRAKA